MLSISRVVPTHAATATSVPGDDVRHRLQRVGIDDREVVELGAGFRCNRLAMPISASLCASRSPASTAAFTLLQRAAQHQRLLTLFGVEIRVARTHGQAVSLAHDGAHHDLHIHVEVADHLAQHRHLRGVLLAEECAVGANNLEQFADHRGDAAEVSGPRAAIQLAR